jgi:predicted ATPase/DNA-binding XRE family transcriptional regulator
MIDTFGEWLLQQRDDRRLTREEFANRVGCSVAMLRKIEYGERRPSAQIAELIANALDIPHTEYETFIKVARGELRVDRISHLPNLTQPSNISPFQSISRNNLPVLPTPLIGRTHELEELNRLLRDPNCRLLTLVGPGGIGKTRLAIESASTILGKFEDGVYFVPFAPVNSSRFIIPVITDSIGFSFQSVNPADPKTQLFNYLREKQILLVIDNLEHLLNEPDITMFSELLAMAPNVKLLVTSRETLNLQAEWVFEVQGLPVSEDPQSETIIQDTSIELFIQRARRAHAGFSPAANDLLAIARICQLVDGMPLAIELAAGWVRTLSCEEIMHELEHSLDILHASTRDLSTRHRSMRAVFDHSWKLLTEDEQQVLARLSLFRGGFRREAAEEVAKTTLITLSALVTKSLVRRGNDGRYDLHELIRQFAAEQFAGLQLEQAATLKRHGYYYLASFGQADERLRSSGLREALSELTTEMDNFRAAWEWAINHSEFALIEQTARMLFILYDTLGWFQEGLDMLGHAINALEMAGGKTSPDRTIRVVLGHILATRAWCAYRLAQNEQAQAMLELSLEILRPLNELRVLVESLAYLGFVMEATGNFARALELYSEGQKTATTIDDQWYATFCFTQHTALAGITHGLVKPDITHERLQSIVADWQLIGDPSLIAHALYLLSQSALRLGRYDEARAALEENVMLNRSINFDAGLGLAYRGLGIVAQTQGQHQQALEMFRKSLDIYTELGINSFVARVLTEMCRSILALGNDAEVGHILRKALRIAADIHGTPVALEALAGFASLLAKQGDREHAIELLLIVMYHPASTQETKNRASRLRAELESQLSSQQIESIQMRANAKTFEDVVRDLLE